MNIAFNGGSLKYAIPPMDTNALGMPKGILVFWIRSYPSTSPSGIIAEVAQTAKLELLLLRVNGTSAGCTHFKLLTTKAGSKLNINI